MHSGARLLLILASSAGALAGPGLLLQVYGPSSVQKVEDLKIITTVTNTGDESLKLLNDPRSPLSDLPTDHFAITNHWHHGTSPDFIGIATKYVPRVAATSSDPLAFTNLAPGQSVSVEHDLSLAYNFSTSGPGQYIINVKELNAFYHQSRGKISALLAGSNLPSHVVNISGSLVSRGATTLRPDTKDCEDWQEAALHSAVPHAKQYIADALDALAREGYKSDDYKRWFGSPSEHRLSTVASHFEALTGNNFTEFTFVCNAPLCRSRPGIFAFVYPDEYGTVHVCDTFFRSPVGGPDSRASTLVHESSHFTRNGGTLDHVYGQALSQELARGYPQLAVMNADNHEYFSVTAKGGDVREDSVTLAQVYFGGEPYLA
ncbi:Metalloprotease [Pilatotrama ljubarskyi]|nr:Metalloprotease [Pilatotrama ljubarskyi]